jgi:catechol 2,3-dioxygenase-like lactoylglutathione lyase family enzyme
MFTGISHHGIYVLDQDEALDFYVGKLGMEVRADVDLGFMRWLTVGARGDDREVLLERPGPRRDTAPTSDVRCGPGARAGPSATRVRGGRISGEPTARAPASPVPCRAAGSAGTRPDRPPA